MKKYIFPAIATALFASAVGAGNSTVSTTDGLVSALSNASNGDVVTLVAGTYSPMSPIEVNAANVTLVSADGKAVTIIDGNASGRILKVNGGNFKAEGITFKNAHTSSNGGAINYNSSSISQTTFIKDCDFIDCTAKYGGAIYAGQNSYTSFGPRANYGVVSGCTFLRCGVDTTGSADDWGGGGAIFGALWVEDSVFDACYCADTSKNQYHAAIDVPSYTTISNCIFRNHTQTKRGLVGSYENQQQRGCSRLVDCLIADNTSSKNDDVLFHRKVVLDRCVISNNSANVTWTQVGLYRLDASGDRGISRVTSCLFIDNKYAFKMNSMPPIENCTFVRNVGGLACDFVESLSFSMTNCVFWANVSKVDSSYKGVPGFCWHPSTMLQNLVQVGNTVIEGGTADANADVAAVLATDDSGNSTALTAAAAADPKGAGFKDAANGDWSLKRSSVLVDAGAWADWMDSARDIAGNRRCLKKGLVKDGALPDIGCYEFCAVAGFKISLR